MPAQPEHRAGPGKEQDFPALRHPRQHELGPSLNSQHLLVSSVS